MKDFYVSIENLLLDFVPIGNESGEELINKIFMGYCNLINQLFPNDDNLFPNENQILNKIIFLLKNINLYSFGLIFIEWIYRNIDLDTDLSINNDVFEKMFDIIILSCTNYIIIDDNLFFSISNLNIEKINFFL